MQEAKRKQDIDDLSFSCLSSNIVGVEGCRKEEYGESERKGEKWKKTKENKNRRMNRKNISKPSLPSSAFPYRKRKKKEGKNEVRKEKRELEKKRKKTEGRKGGRSYRRSDSLLLPRGPVSRNIKLSYALEVLHFLTDNSSDKEGNKPLLSNRFKDDFNSVSLFV